MLGNVLGMQATSLAILDMLCNVFGMLGNVLGMLAMSLVDLGRETLWYTTPFASQLIR